MRISFILVFLLSFTSSLWAQEFNKTVIDSGINKEVLSGPITLNAFNSDLCKTWYPNEYETYSPPKKF